MKCIDENIVCLLAYLLKVLNDRRNQAFVYYFISSESYTS